MIWRVIPAISEGSPRSRCWSPDLNQFQHFPGVGRLRLRGIGDEERQLLGKIVHPRAGGEIVGRLVAAMQHHDKRQGLAIIAARDIELVGARAGGIAVAAAVQTAIRPAAGRGRVRRRASNRAWAPCRTPGQGVFRRSVATRPPSASGIEMRGRFSPPRVRGDGRRPEIRRQIGGRSVRERAAQDRHRLFESALAGEAGRRQHVNF